MEEREQTIQPEQTSISRRDFIKASVLAGAVSAKTAVDLQKKLNSLHTFTEVLPPSAEIFSSTNNKVGYAVVIDEISQAASIYLGQPEEIVDIDGSVSTVLKNTITLADNGQLVETKKPIETRQKGEGLNSVKTYEVLISFPPEIAGLEKNIEDPETQQLIDDRLDSLIKDTGFNQSQGIAKITVVNDPDRKSVILESRINPDYFINDEVSNYPTEKVLLDQLEQGDRDTQIAHGGTELKIRGRFRRTNYRAESTTTKVDPNETHEIDNVIYANKDLAPFPGKQLEVNPELEAVFAEKVFKLCNQYTFLTEMASVISERKNTTPLNDAKYQSFENYMELVVQPAIDGGKTVETYHLVGHSTESRRESYVGMTKLLGEIDPSTCSIVIKPKTDVYPNSLIISGGSYQIGMQLVEIEGKKTRQLIISPDKITENGYGFMFANDKLTNEELALSYSKLLQVVIDEFEEISSDLPGSANSTYKGQLVLGRPGTDETDASISLATARTTGVEGVTESMNSALAYFVPQQ